jgi:hypothetical protein
MAEREGAASVAERHDSGCRMKMPLLPGWMGTAEFRGERDEHRLRLERRFVDLLNAAPHEEFALWCGMNPSGASPSEDDLTIRKEYNWTLKTWGLRHYIKTNVGTLPWTDSRTLNLSGMDLSHPENLATIRSLAAEAKVVVLTTGDPPEVLLPFAREVFAALKADGRQALCLGVTKAGWPKHSSRLGYATPFRPYPF